MLRKNVLVVLCMLILCCCFVESGFSRTNMKQTILTHYRTILLKNQKEAQTKALQGMWSETDGFEENFPGTKWLVISDKAKEYTWGKITSHTYQGSGALFSAGAENVDSFFQGFGFNFVALQNPFLFPEDFKVKWAQLEFYLDLKLDSNNSDEAEFRNGSIGIHFVVETSDSLYYVSRRFEENTDGYQLQTIDLEEYIDETDIKSIWFEFDYYSLNDEIPANAGACLDDIKLQIHFWNAIAANFEASSIAGKAPLRVTFENKSEGAPNHFNFNWGDGYQIEYRESWESRAEKMHKYMLHGEYDVKLTAWNQAYTDALSVPNLVYVDSLFDYYPLRFVEAGQTESGKEWKNINDQKIFGSICLTAAHRDDAWAVFKIANQEQIYVSKIRLLNSIFTNSNPRDAAKKVKLSFSLTGEFTGEETSVTCTCKAKSGIWNILTLREPVLTKFIKIELLSAFDENAEYIELVEIQVMGSETFIEPAPEAPIITTPGKLPRTHQLLGNYPNPFNPETTIHFELEQKSHVVLTVYNIRGQFVQRLLDSDLNDGTHQVQWDARNNLNEAVAGGIYFYKLQIANEDQTQQIVQKMLLMK